MYSFTGHNEKCSKNKPFNNKSKGRVFWDVPLVDGVLLTTVAFKIGAKIESTFRLQMINFDADYTFLRLIGNPEAIRDGVTAAMKVNLFLGDKVAVDDVWGGNASDFEVIRHFEKEVTLPTKTVRVGFRFKVL